MQNSLIKSSSKFTSLSLLVLVIPTVAIEVKQLYFIVLSENSILYIYSTIAQIIASLIALTLISIPYLYNELEIKLRADDTLETAITTAKQNLFEYLLMIFATGIISILFCLITIGAFNYIKFQNISITLSTFSFFNFIAILLYLVFYSFDPERLTKISNNYIEKLNNDNNINTPLSPSTQTVQPEGFNDSNFGADVETSNSDPHKNIERFFIKYLKMESDIIQIHRNKFPNSQSSSFNKVLNELFSFGTFTLEEINMIYEIKIFRNALAHRSPEQEVKPNLLKYYDQRLDKVVSKIDKSKN